MLMENCSKERGEEFTPNDEKFIPIPSPNNNGLSNIHPNESAFSEPLQLSTCSSADNESNNNPMSHKNMKNSYERGWKHEFIKEYLTLQEKLVTQNKEFVSAQNNSHSSTNILPKLSKNLMNILMNKEQNQDLVEKLLNNINQNLTKDPPVMKTVKTEGTNPGEGLLPNAETSKYFSALMDGDGKNNINYQEFVESWHEYKKAAIANNMDPNALIAQSAKMSKKAATRETTSMLKSWLNEHKKNPYPTKGEKIMLAVITRMNLTQVSTWFANARRRLKKENKMTWNPKNRNDPTINSSTSTTPVISQLMNFSTYEETRKTFNQLPIITNNNNKNNFPISHDDKKYSEINGRENYIDTHMNDIPMKTQSENMFCRSENNFTQDIHIKNLLMKLYSVINNPDQQNLCQNIPQNNNPVFSINNNPIINSEFIANLSQFLQSRLQTVHDNRQDEFGEHSPNLMNPFELEESHKAKSIIGSKRSNANSHEELDMSLKNESSYLSENSNSSPAYSSGTSSSDINKRPKIWSIIETS